MKNLIILLLIALTSFSFNIAAEEPDTPHVACYKYGHAYAFYQKGIESALEDALLNFASEAYPFTPESMDKFCDNYLDFFAKGNLSGNRNLVGLRLSTAENMHKSSRGDLRIIVGDDRLVSQPPKAEKIIPDADVLSVQPLRAKEPTEDCEQIKKQYTMVMLDMTKDQAFCIVPEAKLISQYYAKNLPYVGQPVATYQYIQSSSSGISTFSIIGGKVVQSSSF